MEHGEGGGAGRERGEVEEGWRAENCRKWRNKGGGKGKSKRVGQIAREEDWAEGIKLNISIVPSPCPFWPHGLAGPKLEHVSNPRSIPSKAVQWLHLFWLVYTEERVKDSVSGSGPMLVSVTNYEDDDTEHTKSCTQIQ